MKLRAVAFDIDGTLYDNAIMHRRSIWFALRNWRVLNAFRRVRHELRLIRPIENFPRMQAELLAGELKTTPERAQEIIQQLFYDTWEQVLHRVPLCDGVRETIDSFRSAGLKLAVASDFPVTRKLGILNIEGLWNCEISTEAVGYLKPNPEPFRALLDCLDEPAESVLYVGNSYRYDVEGARNVGMPTAHYTRRARPDSVADLSFSNYKILRDWVLTKV
ncbi:MAG: HAD family hydrolase [Spirochaetaceae bacterium]|nr:MAG: HAD family hydrolase [Spirochaetaceae bacterium]